MKIDKDVIAKLDPCKDRFDNYLKFYANKSHTKRQFMGLKNITHEDKLWVAFRLLPKNSIPLCAADIAELVLPIFETKYPNDPRPRKAIEAARSKTMTLEEKRNAAIDASTMYATYATRAANTSAYAAYAAAVYAANTSAYAAYAAAHAAYAAVYASRAASATKRKDQNIEKQIRTIVLKYWK